MSHLIIELKKSWQMNQNEKTRIRRHFRLCLSLVSNGKGTNLHTDGSIKKKKTATFHSTMLYPLSCGELAMNGEHILRLYMTSRVFMMQGTSEQRVEGTSLLILK